MRGTLNGGNKKRKLYDKERGNVNKLENSLRPTDDAGKLLVSMYSFMSRGRKASAESTWAASRKAFASAVVFHACSSACSLSISTFCGSSDNLLGMIGS
jgi:hypothetical protein